MQLTHKPHLKNTYILFGLLLKGNSITALLSQLSQLEINLAHVPIYGIPDVTPNSIWGYYIACDLKNIAIQKLKNYERCQLVHSKLLIPEYSIIYPKISDIEIESLFNTHTHILHPDFGLFALESPIDFTSMTNCENNSTIEFFKPFDSVYIPELIRKIDVKIISPEETIKNMEKNLFPQKEELKEAPLSLTEKLKYTILKQFFKKSEETESSSELANTGFESSFFTYIANLIPSLNKHVEKIATDFEELHHRNSSELDKLMKLFKDNPEEALKYAIPIDTTGTNRGTEQVPFTMTKIWNSFKLFGNERPYGNTGNVQVVNDSFYQLNQQYRKSALDFIKANEYEKAAFIYLKLLKDPYTAAHTLENGKFYQEAASVYLKHSNNKQKAAECYEKGRMTSDAIKLYKELYQFEKVGDLYMSINNQAEANIHYQLVVDEYKNNNQYIKASLILRKKMQQIDAAQVLLLEGWQKNKDQFNCLNNYFNNIKDNDILIKEIAAIYKKDITQENILTFLSVLKYECLKNETVKTKTKDIVYEIISTQAHINPSIVNELKSFTTDSQINKDITRYKIMK